MQDKKQKKAKIQVIFLILISTLVLLADFYAIINYPKEYMLIAAITVIFMICLWGVISGFFSLSALKEDRREEQYDSIFKSEKASYLMLRKYFDEIEEKIEILQKESKIPTEDIINAQKGIAKVVINRNKENADAIMNSNEQLMETFEHLENKLKESNDFIIENQKNVIYDNLKDIMEKQQVLSDSIKDMEIRLSQAITANPIQFTANVEMPKQTTDAPQSAPAMEAIPEPVVEEAAIAEPEPVAVIEPEPVIPWRIAGEVLDTYIVCEDEDKNVWLIDKHAAHERVNFDRMKANQEPLMCQALLAPLVAEFAAEEYSALAANLELLREFGFECEEFGGGSLILRAIPADIDSGDAIPALEELADKLVTAHTVDPAAARDALLHTMACKAAIKGGWKSDLSELRVLVDKVQSGEVQFCPHGRPVKAKLTKYELEKMFKRA